MSEPTKACNLTKDEIESLIEHLARVMSNPNVDKNEIIERINYLNKRFKSFNEVEIISEHKPIKEGNDAW